MSISRRIKDERNKLGITQQQLAFDTGLSIGGIQSIETGRARPSIETLEKLADRFGCTTDYLLGRDDVYREYTESEVFTATKVAEVMRDIAIELNVDLKDPVKRDTLLKLISLKLNGKDPS